MALTDGDKIRLVEDHCRSFWEGDIRDLERQLGPGFIDTGAVQGLQIGVEGAKAWARVCRRATPDMRVLVMDALVVGDVVAVRAKGCGTHTGPFMGRPPTGARIELDGIVVWELDTQGQIIGRTGFVDYASALTQELPARGNARPPPGTPLTAATQPADEPPIHRHEAPDRRSPQ